MIDTREIIAGQFASNLDISAIMAFLQTTKAVVTDIQFVIPFVVLLIGIFLLIGLH